MSIVWQIGRLIVGCLGWVLMIPIVRRFATWRFQWSLRRRGLSAEEAEILAEIYGARIGLRELFRAVRSHD